MTDLAAIQALREHDTDLLASIRSAIVRSDLVEYHGGERFIATDMVALIIDDVIRSIEGE